MAHACNWKPVRWSKPMSFLCLCSLIFFQPCIGPSCTHLLHTWCVDITVKMASRRPRHSCSNCHVHSTHWIMVPSLQWSTMYGMNRTQHIMPQNLSFPGPDTSTTWFPQKERPPWLYFRPHDVCFVCNSNFRSVSWRFPCSSDTRSWMRWNPTTKGIDWSIAVSANKRVFCFIGGIAPLQASGCLLRISPYHPSSDFESLMVHGNRSVLIRNSYGETRRTWL